MIVYTPDIPDFRLAIFSVTSNLWLVKKIVDFAVFHCGKNEGDNVQTLYMVEVNKKPHSKLFLRKEIYPVTYLCKPGTFAFILKQNRNKFLA
jgi:hypothetical protein